LLSAKGYILTALKGTTTRMFGNIGLPEMVFIMAIALLVFGPKKLPEIGRTIGKAIRDFKKSTEDIKDKFEEEIRAEEFKSIRDDLKKDLREADIGKDLTIGKDLGGDGENKKES